VRVPADLIETGWDHQRILTEPNAEVRRAAIEITGWDQFIVNAGLELLDECPDPANPGYSLALYEIPERIYEERVRVVLCTNASPERDGTRRRFGLTVPADVSDALAGIPWTFDVDPQTYKQLSRAT